ncbi:MAG: 2-oxoacid:acceptor oxidoreductase family protein, partial [Candidatus Omnitrophota bacterium]
MSKRKKSISLLICGEAGQGIQTVEVMLTKIIKDEGFNVYATKEYMSRVRGGSNSAEIRISNEDVRAPVNFVDICVLLDKEALKHVEDRLSGSTIILAEKSIKWDSEHKIIDLPFTQEAEVIGSNIYGNTIAVGVILGMMDLDDDKALESVKKGFYRKGEDIVENNLKAVLKGYEIARSLIDSGQIQKERFALPERADMPEKEILCNGAEAIGMGAIAGGCNFISSYPMSPSTGVLTFLAQQASKFGIIAEQAEDEISAINMALGAWYAGARAIVTTSGGGFALMGEGVSLSGMMELPIIVHLAQRPGPATGLPTRTEQGDLELALYSGHGEFPRAIFAPGSVEEAFFSA